ncbi:MAG: AAA family ATPase [Bacteroidia bacterium]|nr:AAA family ATPase [Bacteroidia bacterium]NND26943.1 AAA family ATPase [Flavobacteriaceae bacterium]
MIIVLIGYMASGKSVVGQELALKLNYDFIDLDTYIESEDNRNISEIFKDSGEIYFRTLESKCLKQLISNADNTVLALGGGTPCYGDNLDSILKNEKCITIYLQASLPTLVKRLKNEKSTRPIIAKIKSEEALLEFIGKHLFERSAFYNRAQIKITTDNESMDAIIEKIIFKLF